MTLTNENQPHCEGGLGGLPPGWPTMEELAEAYYEAEMMEMIE
jgi:hypothetical protein